MLLYYISLFLVYLLLNCEKAGNVQNNFITEDKGMQFQILIVHIQMMNTSNTHAQHIVYDTEMKDNTTHTSIHV